MVCLLFDEMHRRGAGVPPNYSAGAPEDHRSLSGRCTTLVAPSDLPEKNPRAKMSTSIRLARPAGGHGFRGRLEGKMDMLLATHWRSIGPKAGAQETDWLDPPPSGFVRLLAALAIIGAAVCLLDHAAGRSPADTTAASSYDLTREWR
jgi:hypothetical protein